MKKYIFFVVVAGFLIMALIFLTKNQKDVPILPQGSNQNTSQSLPQQKASNNQNLLLENNNVNNNLNTNVNSSINSDFLPPLPNAKERVTKKAFGQFITKQNSPVQPERFFGFHTGTDFETYPNEQDSEVSVHSVCSGKMLIKKHATGYGGVMVESCMLDGQNITVVYGHLKLSSISKNPGDTIQKGDELGILGKGYSEETDGERKHLHLGFHKGGEINILGYLQNKTELKDWINPCDWVCK